MEKSFAKKMAEQKENAKDIKAKYNYTSIQDFQFNGFKIRPPVRDKTKKDQKNLKLIIYQHINVL